MKDTGERMIDAAHEGKPVWGEHYSRYIFSKQLVTNKVVADGSCGSGYGTNYLSKFGKAKFVYGIDVSSEAIKYAKKHYPSKDISFIEANLEKMPLEDKSIDVFVSFETIEHIKNYEKFVKEIKRVLKNDGILVLS